MRERLYQILAAGFVRLTICLSVVDSGMFFIVLKDRFSWPHALFAVSMLGVAVPLFIRQGRRKPSPRLNVVCMVWLFINAFVFLLLPLEAYYPVIAGAAPLDWIFKPVAYFFLMGVTVVTLTQASGRKEE